MKKIFLTAAFVALAASTALAGPQHRNKTANDSFAYSAPDSRAIIVEGQIVGQDPDPAIRHDLLRQGDMAHTGS